MRVLAIVLLLCGVVSVGATTLSTPLVLTTGPNGTTGVACTFVNVSSMSLTVTVSLLDIDGHVLDTDCAPTGPQFGGAINPGSSPLSFRSVRCLFSFDGPARALRGAMELYDVPEVPRAVLPAT